MGVIQGEVMAIERLTVERDEARAQVKDLQHDFDVAVNQKLDDLSTELKPLRAEVARLREVLEEIADFLDHTPFAQAEFLEKARAALEETKP